MARQTTFLGSPGPRHQVSTTPRAPAGSLQVWPHAHPHTHLPGPPPLGPPPWHTLTHVLAGSPLASPCLPVLPFPAQHGAWTPGFAGRSVPRAPWCSGHCARVYGPGPSTPRAALCGAGSMLSHSTDEKTEALGSPGTRQVGAGDGTFTQMPGPQKCGREGGRRGRGQVGGSRRHEEGELQTEMPFEGSLEWPPPRGQVPRVEQHTLHQLGTHCAHGRGARPTRGREGRTPHLAQGPQFSQQTGATISH